MKSFASTDSTAKEERILILSLSGIGNFVMHTPFLECLRRNRPHSHITIWVAPRGVAPLARLIADKVIEKKLPKGALSLLRYATFLRQQNFSETAMLSPGQLWKGAFVMYVTGAKDSVAHAYPHLGNPESRLFLSNSVKEEADLHDIEQNLRLLPLLGVDPSEFIGEPYRLLVPQQHLDRGRKIMAAKGDQMRIGFHAGSAPGFIFKQWPSERFAELARTLGDANLYYVFGGPDEEEQKRQLVAAIGANARAVTGPLLDVAGALKCLDLFVSNDSGLMHIAAAVGTPTVGLFGPTDERLTGPRGVKSWSVRAPGTTPTYSTEAGAEGDNLSMQQLSVAMVASFLQQNNLLSGHPSTNTDS